MVNKLQLKEESKDKNVNNKQRIIHKKLTKTYRIFRMILQDKILTKRLKRVQ